MQYNIKLDILNTIIAILGSARDHFYKDRFQYSNIMLMYKSTNYFTDILLAFESV